MNKKIVIIDSRTEEIHVYSYDPNVHGDPADFVQDNYSEHGKTFNIGQCHWMVIDLEDNEGRLPIYIH